MFLAEIPLLVVTPLCSLRNPFFSCYSAILVGIRVEPTDDRARPCPRPLRPSILFIFSGIAKTKDGGDDRD